MSKYASLPDIDTAPDVYETPDVPDVHITERDDDSDNEVSLSGVGPNQSSHNSRLMSNLNNLDIIPSNLDQAFAKKKFGSASQLDSTDVDFSNSLLKKKNLISRSSASKYPRPNPRSRTFETSEYSILPRGYNITKNKNKDSNDDDYDDEKEEPLDRLRRLKFEINELEEELILKEQFEKTEKETVKGNDENEDKDAVDESLKKDSGLTKSSKKPNNNKVGPSPAELLLELQNLQETLGKLSTSISSPSSSTDPNQDSISALRKREAYAKTLLQQLTDQKSILNQPEEGKSSENPSSTSKDPKLSKIQPSGDPTVTTTIRLDERLNSIERLLGSNNLLQSSNTGDITLPPPLLVTISKLEHQLSLLTQPRHLDSISRRVKVIVTDLERVHEARRKLADQRPISIALASGITVVTQNQIGSSSNNPNNPNSTANPSSSANQNQTSSSNSSSALSALPGVISTSDPTQPSTTTTSLNPDSLYKLERLYNLLPRIDPLLPLVPHLLNRLRSLSKLHNESNQFRSRLNESSGEVNETIKRSKNLEKILEEIEKNFEKNEKIVGGNLRLIDERIEKIVECIDNLKKN